MAGENEREQRNLVRERFTRTAEEFASFSFSERGADTDLLLEMTAPQASDCVLDVACGPGTFALQFAPRVRSAVGLDFTPALVAQARKAAANAGLANLSFTLGDALALPFPSDTFDLVTCGYSLHHLPDAPSAAREMARVARPGGRVAVVDLIVPAPGLREASDAIERARDASHTRKLTADELPALLESCGLHVREVKQSTEVRSFKRWMRLAGWQPGDAAYEATWQLMEASIDRDTAGFHPRRTDEAKDDILFIHSAEFVVAEKA